MNRRDFFKVTGGAAAMLAFRNKAYAFSNSMPLRKFVQPLRGVSLPPYSSPGIPVFRPDVNSLNGVDHYSIVAQQFTDKLHPNLAGTKLWGYADANNPVGRHLGGIIIAQRNRPVQLSVTNKLPVKHILPVDTSADFATAPSVQNGIAVHLHGGVVPWISDGSPFDWFGPGAVQHGLSFQNNDVVYPCTRTGDAEYFYPNRQGARMMWYHDHAHDVTRLNAYAGLATAYIIRDAAVEAGLNLPLIEAGGREIPLVFQDKIFKNGNPQAVRAFPQYELPVGDLWYPYIYDRSRWSLAGSRIPGVPSVVAESFGDTPLVNGTVYPTVKLEPTRYRFRILNACNARFVNLQLIQQDNSASGITLDAFGNPTNASGPNIVQIAAEAGFLPAAVTFPGYVNATGGAGTTLLVTFDPLNGHMTSLQHNLLLAPAERADVVVDFSGFAGKTLILYNDAPAPFPGGDPSNDYRPVSNAGPDTRTLMQIVVGTVVGPQPVFTPNHAALIAAAADPAFLVTPGVTTLPAGVPVRDLTLNETFDSYGRLRQQVGTTVATGGAAPNLTFGAGWLDPATEVVTAGAVEIWRIANTTADTHPMHYHLVNVQVISRQTMNLATFNNTGSIDAALAGMPPAVPAEPNELGWKETIRMNPSEVTTFIAKFDLPAGLPFTVPSSNRAGLAGQFGLGPLAAATPGVTIHEYVYHCHILEHEEHDMMRPLVIKSTP